MQNLCLKAIGVLIFVNENMVEPVADGFGDLRLSHHLRPEQQQVIVINDILLLFRPRVGSKKIGKIIRPLAAPGKLFGQHLCQEVCPN